MQTHENPAPRREDLPDGQIRVSFGTPIIHFGEATGSVTFRPPTVSEIWEIGDPRSYIFNDAGLGTPYTDRERLRQWIGRLMVDHDADVIGRERDPALGMLIEEVVLGFFYERAEAIDERIRALVARGIAPSEIEKMSLPRLSKWANFVR